MFTVFFFFGVKLKSGRETHFWHFLQVFSQEKIGFHAHFFPFFCDFSRLLFFSRPLLRFFSRVKNMVSRAKFQEFSRVGLLFSRALFRRVRGVGNAGPTMLHSGLCSALGASVLPPLLPSIPAASPCPRVGSIYFIFSFHETTKTCRNLWLQFI